MKTGCKPVFSPIDKPSFPNRHAFFNHLIQKKWQGRDSNRLPPEPMHQIHDELTHRFKCSTSQFDQQIEIILKLEIQNFELTKLFALFMKLYLFSLLVMGSGLIDPEQGNYNKQNNDFWEICKVL